MLGGTGGGGGAFTGVFHWVITYSFIPGVSLECYTTQLLFGSNLTFPLVFPLVKELSDFVLTICMTIMS